MGWGHQWGGGDTPRDPSRRQKAEGPAKGAGGEAARGGQKPGGCVGHTTPELKLSSAKADFKPTFSSAS